MVTVEQTRLREPGFASKGKRLARSSSRGDDGSLPPIREGNASRDGSLQHRDVLHRGGQQRISRSQSRGPTLGPDSGARDNSLPPLMRPQPAAPEAAMKPPRRLPHKVESSGRAYPDAGTPPRYSTGQQRVGDRVAAPQPADSREVGKANAETIQGRQQPTNGQRRAAGSGGDGSRGRARQPPFAEHESIATRVQAPGRPTAAGGDGALSRPAVPVGVDEAGGDDHLLPCPHCQRTFNAKAHAKHVPLCVKVFEKSRKTFKAVEQRMPKEAIQASKVAQRGQRTKAANKADAPGDKKLNTKWRHQSEAFRAAIKDARVVEQYRREGKSLSNLPQPRRTPAELDDRVPCPHCGRRFGQQQADRHIPSCAKAKARPNPPPRAAQGTAGSQQRQPNRR
mmetsp:Transcript_31306/g.71476  ORF Transcript_31306/g.71476 Transcript_31306/m.71476 type:complete len:395 (+) Transcript_31306:68-1252(+)